MRWLAVMLVACGGAAHPKPALPELQLVPLSSVTRTPFAVFGIHPLDRVSIDQSQLVHRLDSEVRDAIDARDDIVLVSPARPLLDAMLLHNCSGPDSACLAAISADAGADFVVFGLLDAQGALRLQLYGARTGALGGATALHDGEVTRGAVDRVVDGYHAQCEAKLRLYGAVMTGGTVALDEQKPQLIRDNRFSTDALVAGRHHLAITSRSAAPLAVDFELPCDGATYHVVRQ